MKTYIFHVSLPDTGRVWRKLELQGDQTLEDLHFAIQNAYDWEADHLYSFFMNNKAWDPQSEYTLPEGALYEEMEEEYANEDDEDDEEGETFSLEDWRAMSKKEQDDLVSEFTRDTSLPASFFHDMIDELERLEQNPDLLEEEDVKDVRTATLDSLKLHPNQEFMYLFDYGDEHRFKVKVDGINAVSDPDAVFPRIVESVGESPPQYAGWDEDWDEEDDTDSQ